MPYSKRSFVFRKYKKLPEVVEQVKLQKRSEQYSLNRLKARLFNRVSKYEAHLAKNLFFCLGSPTRLDTIQPVQLNRLARRLSSTVPRG